MQQSLPKVGCCHQCLLCEDRKSGSGWSSVAFMIHFPFSLSRSLHFLCVLDGPFNSYQELFAGAPFQLEVPHNCTQNKPPSSPHHQAWQWGNRWATHTWFQVIWFSDFSTESSEGFFLGKHCPQPRKEEQSDLSITPVCNFWVSTTTFLLQPHMSFSLSL